jgi:hypothetical protein
LLTPPAGQARRWLGDRLRVLAEVPQVLAYPQELRLAITIIRAAEFGRHDRWYAPACITLAGRPDQDRDAVIEAGQLRRLPPKGGLHPVCAAVPVAAGGLAGMARPHCRNLARLPCWARARRVHASP